MKIKHGYILRNVASETIVVPTQEAAINFNGILTLNESGKLLWERLSQGATEAELLEMLMEHYDVQEKEAQSDIELFLDKLRAHHILEDA
ncbi:MAG: PqqD family protein [Candidatus Izemoplasmatales bacterium]|jgi:hypothetical protein|nr:PqqD family protein [Candidatus Izemoplasmatales bacterium]MDD5293134.1 PqqD family protein [Candidatus Izemoplasmatales bacterium]